MRIWWTRFAPPFVNPWGPIIGYSWNVKGIKGKEKYAGFWQLIK